MIEGYRLSVQCQDSSVGFPDEVAIFIKGEGGIQTEINISLSVIVEGIQVQAADLRPHILGQMQGVGAVLLLRPYQLICIKLICGDVLLHGFRGNGSVIDAASSHEQGEQLLHGNLLASVSAAGKTAVGGGGSAVVLPGSLSCALVGCKGPEAVRVILIHADGLIGVQHSGEVFFILLREVDGKSVGIRHIRRSPVVLYGSQYGFRQLLRAVGSHPLGEVYQVHLVDFGGSGKFSCIVSRAGNGLVLTGCNHAAGILGERRKLLRHGIGKLRQVHHGKGGRLSAALLIAHCHEIIGDLLADLGRGHGGIAGKLGQPVAVIPAHAGLRLLGSHQIIGVVRKHQSVLRGSHQACVEADEIKLHARTLQRAVDGSQVHGSAGGVLLVISVAGHGTAAVIPEDQLIAVCREIRLAELDEPGQSLGIRHDAVPVVVHQTLQSSGGEPVNLVPSLADKVISPGLAAAGIDNNIDIVTQRGILHLLQIIGGHAAAGFQIRTAHIDHDGDGILVITLDLCKFVPGTRCHALIQRTGVVIDAAPGCGGGSGHAVGALRTEQPCQHIHIKSVGLGIVRLLGTLRGTAASGGAVGTLGLLRNTRFSGTCAGQHGHAASAAQKKNQACDDKLHQAASAASLRSAARGR